MPLYQVRLTGVTLSSVTAVFSTVKNQAELQADVNTLNGNLANGHFVVADYPSGSLKAINKSGIYYIYNAVTDKPIASGGVLIVRFAVNNASTGAGIFIANTTLTDNNIFRVSIISGTWYYVTIT